MPHCCAEGGMYRNHRQSRKSPTQHPNSAREIMFDGKLQKTIDDHGNAKSAEYVLRLYPSGYA